MTTKKTHTLKEVDELTMNAEREGFIAGMVVANNAFYEALTELKTSVENIQAIYDLGNYFGKKTAKVEELQFVWDTLTHLNDMFQGRYDTAIDKTKDQDMYDELVADLDLVNWRDSIASLKEEWPE